MGMCVSTNGNAENGCETLPAARDSSAIPDNACSGRLKAEDAVRELPSSGKDETGTGRHNVPCLADLSCDILSLVCSHIPPQDLRNVRLVCKTWRTAVEIAGKLRPVQVKWYMLPKKFPTLTELDLSLCGRQLYDSMLRYMPCFPQLRVLNLASASNLTGEDFPSLHQLTNLEVLCLRGCRKLKDEGLQALCNIVSLTSLDLSQCKGVSSDTLRSLVCLPRLETLMLDDLPAVDDEVLVHCRENSPGLLSTISLVFSSHNPSISDVGAEALAQLPLRTLKLAGCPNVTHAGVKHLAASTTLKHMELTVMTDMDISDTSLLTTPHIETLQCHGFINWHQEDLASLTRMPTLQSLCLTDASLHNVSSLSFLHDLQRVTSLGLGLSGMLSPEAIPDVANLPTRLRSLDLFLDATTGTCAAIMHALSNATFLHLTRLAVSSLTPLKDELVRTIAASPQLQHFVFELLPDLATDVLTPSPSYQPFVQLTALTTLAMTVPAGVDTSLLEACVHLTRLRCLQLRVNYITPGGGSRKMRLSDDLLLKLQDLQALQHLEISECSTLTKRGAASLAALPDLRTLILENCAMVANQVIPCLSNLTGLRVLVLHGPDYHVNSKTLGLLAPLKYLRFISVLDPSCSPWERRSSTLQTIAASFNPSRGEASQLSENALVSFLDSHPVLQDYEFINGCLNGNGRLHVRRSGGNVFVSYA